MKWYIIPLLFAATSSFGQGINERTAALLDSSDVYEFSNRPKSYDFLLQAAEIIEPTSDLEYAWMKGRYHIYRGIYHSRTGSYEKALSNFQNAIDAFEPLRAVDSLAQRAEKGIASGYHNIGNAFYRMGNYDKAIELYQKSYEQYLSMGDSLYAAGSYSNMGSVYQDQGMHELALEYFQKSGRLFASLDARYQLSANYHNVAKLYRELGLYDSATLLIGRALSIRNERSDTSGMALDNIELGLILIEQDHPAEAIECFQKALRFAQQSENQKSSSTAMESLSMAYEMVGDFQKAYANLKLHEILEDSLINESNQKNLLDMEVKYETEKKDLEISSLTRQNESEYRRKVQAYVIAGIALFSLVLIAYVLLLRSRLFRSREQMLKETQRRQQMELELKEQELSSMSTALLNKNDTLSRVRDKIEQDASDPKEILRLIRENMNLEEDWDQFKIHFEKVHQGFFEQLNTKYPDLTPHEHKLCAYLKLNFSTKQISQMLSVSVSAVDKSRNRLRKKLDITPQENLVSFIQQL